MHTETPWLTILLGGTVAAIFSLGIAFNVLIQMAVN